MSSTSYRSIRNNNDFATYKLLGLVRLLKEHFILTNDAFVHKSKENESYQSEYEVDSLSNTYDEISKQFKQLSSLLSNRPDWFSTGKSQRTALTSLIFNLRLYRDVFAFDFELKPSCDQYPFTDLDRDEELMNSIHRSIKDVKSSIHSFITSCQRVKTASKRSSSSMKSKRSSSRLKGRL